MKRLSLSYIIVLISAALLVLVGLQLYQAKQLYEQTKDELDVHINNALSKVVIRHEKADDFKRYNKLFQQDFSGQYRKALKQEFQNLLPVQESVSIRDTFIELDGRKAKYLFITGESYDSISDVKATHSVLARDISEMAHLVQLGKSKSIEDTSSLGFELDKRVITNLFKKSSYINELMVNAFRSADFLASYDRIDLAFLDSIMNYTFKDEGVSRVFQYVIYDDNNEAVQFPAETDRYNLTLDTTNTFQARLFPGNIFDEPLVLHVFFPQKGVALLNEMWIALLVSVFLVILIVISFYVMFQTILNQRRLADAKNDFISNMTHEFKTPISTISLACEAMKDHDMIGHESAKIISPYTKMIDEENKRLGSLVERILQSAILDRGELKLKSEDLELNELVTSVIQKSRIRIPKESGQITCDLAPGMLHFKGDAMHTSNLITNLVDNAIKYSKNKVNIGLTTRKTPEGFELEVKDEGIGIKSEHIDKIFDKLYRVPTGNVHDVKGFGLGLSYAKAIAELEGWKLEVKSKFGEGSTFKLTIFKEQ